MLIAIPYGDVGILVNQASFVNDDGYYYAVLCFHCAVYTKINAEFAVTLRNAQERPSSKVRHPLSLQCSAQFRRDLGSSSGHPQAAQVVGRQVSQPTAQVRATIAQSNHVAGR